MQKQDIYDIIIENSMREWKYFMKNNLSNDKWEIPLYSRKRIDRAGQTIANASSTPDEWGKTLQSYVKIV